MAGNDVKWKHGFVVRVLWFGFVLRWCKYTKRSWEFWTDHPHLHQ